MNDFISTQISCQMDPRLQRAIARHRLGLLEMATASTGPDEIAVVAKVSNLKKWEALSEVRVGADLGKADGTWLVTARVPVSRIDFLRNLKFVVSLKAARPLRPMLQATVIETRAAPDLLPPHSLSNGGAGCVVGIIDYGCDFAHRNFRHPDGSTRLLSIWNQGAGPGLASPFGYGREYTPEQINAALATQDPYSALGYGPRRDSFFSRGSHGTHVMDIAAGNGNGSGVAGMAPNADLIFVHISHTDIPFEGPDVVMSDFGDSVHLLEAAAYIFDKAAGRPCVINVSLGTNGGPHDGSTPVEQGLDRLIRAAPNRAITIAASNSFADGIHAAGTIAAEAQVDLQWDIPAGDRTYNELEIWFSGADRLDVEMIQPDGTSLGIIEPGINGTLRNGSRIMLFVANRLSDPNNLDNTIGIFMEENFAPGRWTIRLHGKDIAEGGAFHAWIERDNLSQSQFVPPHDNTHTLGSVSCSEDAIVVASYDAHKDNQPISYFSSAGPTRDGREKPELSAPGHAVLAAHSRTVTGVTRKSGTSMAAPAVCGIIALMLGEARARGTDLDISDIRDILATTARSSPPAGAGWDGRYGHGRIDARAALEAVMRLGGPGVPIADGGTENQGKRRATGKGAKRG